MADRPKVRVKKDILVYFFESIAFLSVVVTWFWIFVHYKELPETVPIHFDLSGNPDGYGTKDLLLGVPFISTSIVVIMFLLARHPHIHNYSVPITEENAERQYRNSMYLVASLSALIGSFFAYLAYKIVIMALNPGSGIPGISLLLFLILITALTFYFLIRSKMIR